jgi:hypothetical protein
MIVIVGCVIVLSAVLIGFTWSEGHVGALIHPSEIITIGGAASGALLVSSPKKVLVDVFRGLIQTIKGSPYDKQAYVDLFALLYEFFRIARRDGLLAWETRLSDPHASPIFEKYPRIVGNHHVTDFLCDALSTAADGGANPEQLSSLLQTEIRVMDEEHHAAVTSLARTRRLDSRTAASSTTIDGAASSTLTLTAGTYTPTELPAHLEEVINADDQLSGRTVAITVERDQLQITSNSYGSSSQVTIGSGTALAALGLTGAESDNGVDARVPPRPVARVSAGPGLRPAQVRQG